MLIIQNTVASEVNKQCFHNLLSHHFLQHNYFERKATNNYANFTSYDLKYYNNVIVLVPAGICSSCTAVLDSMLERYPEKTLFM